MEGKRMLIYIFIGAILTGIMFASAIYLWFYAFKEEDE
jgi:hypothetical protein